MQKSGAGRNFENAVGEVGDNAQHAPHLERHGRARLTALQSQRAMYMAYLNRYTDAYVYVCVYVVCSMCMHLHGCGHVKQTCSCACTGDDNNEYIYIYICIVLIKHGTSILSITSMHNNAQWDKAKY